MTQQISPQALPSNVSVQVALQAYARELTRSEDMAKTLSKQQILRLLLVRDAIESKLKICGSIIQQAGILAQLSELDNRLQGLAPVLVKDSKLADCRRSRQPKKTDWWWWLESYIPEPQPHTLDRLDWQWNILIATSLAVSASFLIITAQTFSVVGGFDWIQTLSTLLQVIGLVAIAGGALTNRGQRLVKTILEKLHVPARFYSKVTRAACILLLLGSYTIYSSLPSFSNYYYEKGLKAQKSGNFYGAVDYFKEAIAFNPDAIAPHNHLADVYQHLEKFQEAQAEYQDGLLKGDIVALNGMGTLSLTAADNGHSNKFGELGSLLNAEVLFRIGLDQVNSDRPELEAILHRNLGITLMKRSQAKNIPEQEAQALLQEAAQNFQASIKLEQTIISEETYPGQGIAYCYIAALNEKKGFNATEHWQACQMNAYPASLEQYEDVLRLGAGAIGLQLNTQHILESNLS